MNTDWPAPAPSNDAPPATPSMRPSMRAGKRELKRGLTRATGTKGGRRALAALRDAVVNGHPVR